MIRPLQISLLCAAVAGSLLAVQAVAQNYPAKPIRFVVPFAPGGGTDIIGRIVAKSPADGYTLLFGNISLAFNQALYASLPYGAVRDFSPVTLTSVQPNIVVIYPGLPAQTVAEFAALARAKPGQLTYGSAGIGSGTHLSAELLAQSLKISLLHVPYRGTGPALTDTTIAPALPLVKSGRLRALGVTSAKRSAATPDIPTLMEAGVAGYDYSTWYGILAPAQTPRAIIELLHRKTLAGLAREDAKRKLDAQGVDTITNTPAEFHAYLKAETRKWIDVVRAAGIPQQ